jgi:hypothetical protein
MSIDSKDLGTIDGFDLAATLEPDHDSTPYDAECYDAQDIEAWRAGDWSYVGTVVTASKAGIELGSASLWGSESGYLCGREVSPLDGDGDAFVNGYGPQLICEAIEEAQRKLGELRA